MESDISVVNNRFGITEEALDPALDRAASGPYPQQIRGFGCMARTRRHNKAANLRGRCARAASRTGGTNPGDRMHHWLAGSQRLSPPGSGSSK